jgi:S-sulfo-L-cysteine synthase (3-phospho-L-serine-dependent)
VTGLPFVLVESNTTGTGRDFAEAAVARGLRPVLLSHAPNRYPYVGEIGLEAYEVDTSSPASVEEACRRLSPAGIAGITSSSEYFIQTAAAVGRSLGLPAPDPDAIGRCRDKAEQRCRLGDGGIAIPRFAECRTVAEVVAAATRMGAPVVVKPVFGSGSVGVRACADPASAGRWARHLLETEPQVLVEYEIRGPEFYVEIVDGRAVGLTRKHVGAAPYFVETGHDYPARVPPAVDTALCTTAERAVRHMGLLTGPAHVELRLSTAGEAVIVEINPRLAGGLIPRLVRHASGRNLIDEVIARAAGLPVADGTVGAGFASIRFLVPEREGLVEDLADIEHVRALPGVVEARYTVAKGARITVEHSFVDRKGHVIATGRTAWSAVSAADRAVAALEITYAPDQEGTQR